MACEICQDSLERWNAFRASSACFFSCGLCSWYRTRTTSCTCSTLHAAAAHRHGRGEGGQTAAQTTLPAMLRCNDRGGTNAARLGMEAGRQRRRRRRQQLHDTQSHGVFADVQNWNQLRACQKSSAPTRSTQTVRRCDRGRREARAERSAPYELRRRLGTRGTFPISLLGKMKLIPIFRDRRCSQDSLNSSMLLLNMLLNSAQVIHFHRMEFSRRLVLDYFS